MEKFAYLFLFIGVSAVAQQTVTIEQCYQLAQKNYPMIKQYDLIGKTENYTLDNLSKTFFPQISLSGQATYQTDVTRLVLQPEAQKLLSQLPEQINPSDLISTMPKDQYKIYVQASQMIYDGGKTRNGKDIATASGDVERQKLDVDLYGIREKINQLYFGILSVDEQMKMLDSYYSDLDVMENTVKSAVKNGVAMSSDIDLVNVEKLNLDQKKIELQSEREAFVAMLSIFIGEKLGNNLQLQKPTDTDILSDEILRPELQLYDKQRRFYEAQRNGIFIKNHPELGVFVQGGYGRPALNMLNSDFKLYAVGGVQFTWNFGNLYTKKNDLNLIQNNLDILNVQEETFRFNTQLQMQQIRPEIEKYKKLINSDNDIVNLHTRILKTSQSKYDNGVYMMKDLISDMNAKNIAEQTQSLHHIQYLMSLYDYKYVQGEIRGN